MPEQMTSLLAASIEESIKTTCLLQEFKFIGKMIANRVRNEQLIVLHKKSNIQCMIEFNTKSTLERMQKASEIIQDYINLHPIC